MKRRALAKQKNTIDTYRLLLYTRRPIQNSDFTLSVHDRDGLEAALTQSILAVDVDFTTMTTVTFKNITTTLTSEQNLSSFSESNQSLSNRSDDYDYNLDDSMLYLPKLELILICIFYGLTLLLGLIGNVLVIISVARFKKMQNVTNIFLLSLATADLLVVLICVPIKGAAFFSYTWRFGEFLCKAVNYLQNVSIICSVMNLSGLSLERYYAILHPMRAKYTCTVNLAKKTIVLIWILSAIMASPILAGQIHKEVGMFRKAYWCTLEWNHHIYSKIYGIYIFLVILVFPVFLMTFAYTSICHRLWLVRYNYSSSQASTEKEPAQEVPMLSQDGPPPRPKARKLSGFILIRRRVAVDESAVRKQVIKMLLAVVVIFLVCWGPLMVNNLLVSFHIIDNLHIGFLKQMRQGFHVLAYFNSCVNPIVYGFMSKNFRNSFRYTIFLICRGRPVHHFPVDAMKRLSYQTRSTSFGSLRTTSIRDSDKTRQSSPMAKQQVVNTVV
ncbi:hypothetical protein ScPMuIL_005315 [Solemya velum]